ncbi:hypothetical protein R1flu_006352 [Riccia fluitans]|uniref:Protein kinase domain-containing protein n=1 Tax=Riccia fluitans TaxID=41844 RepID=A0ABD1YVZ2_9MARC
MGDRREASSSSDSSLNTGETRGSSAPSGKEDLRVPPRHLVQKPRDDEADSSKRQRIEQLEPFSKRLFKILPRTKILERDDDYSNHYKKTSAWHKGDAYTCVGDSVSFLVTRVREKTPSIGVIFDKPELEYFRLYRELLILGRILPPHEHIVNLRDVLVTKKKVYIISEECHWTDLEKFFPTATNRSAHLIFKQLCQVVQFMHRYGVVNNYLLPRSIFFRADVVLEGVKVFNFARACYSPALATAVYDNFNFAEWLEPDEMYYASYMCSPKSDIVMLGRILMAMFQGGWDLRSPKFRTHKFDDEAHDLLKLLGPPPLQRLPGVDMTLDDILRHPWMLMEPRKP